MSDETEPGSAVRIADREALARTPAHETALACLGAGIDAARPERVLRDALSLAGDQLRIEGAVYDLGAFDEVVVIGGGKAAGQVAAALESTLGDAVTDGVVVTDDPVTTDRVDVVEGSHPVPDEAGEAGARRVRELAERADENALVLAVITGGGSALLPAPAAGLDLADLQATTDALLDAGAAIEEINAVRKHLSAVKGGRLAAAAAPATVVTLAFSDVVGDDPGVIASGPTVPDPTTYGDALDVLARYDLDVPAAVREHLAAGAAGDRPETPGPDGDDAGPNGDGVGLDGDDGPDGDVDEPDGDDAGPEGDTGLSDGARMPDGRYHVLASGWTAVEAARDVARDGGYDPLVLSTRVRGEAREQGLAHAAVAEEVAATGNPVEPPAVVISAGETTVTVSGDGEGGPNQEFALRAALDLPDGAVLGAVDTDGRDGASDVAGALVDGETVPDAETATAARAALADNDALPFLGSRGALVRTGRTGTNVNDLRVLVVE